MKTRVQKWGNSLAVRIPKSFAEGLGFENNAPVELSLEEGAVVIKPDKERTWDLATLLAEVTGENVHPSWETGEAGLASEDDGEAGP